jgi:diguanylate cyclase (GGDEF)-like protein
MSNYVTVWPARARGALQTGEPASDDAVMQWLSRARSALNIDNDALAAHRHGICLRLSRLGALALLPFTLLHLVNANWIVFAVNLVLSSVMAANAWSLQRGRGPAMPFWVLCCLMIGGVFASVRLQGSYGVLWAYPALFMFFFVLPRRQAMALALVLLGVTTATATVSLGMPLALRLLMSMGFTLVMIHTVLNVVGELQRALVEQAITDPLTGAYNRRHLQARLGERVAPSAGADIDHALLLIDIDHFKRINDQHGHDAGDAVLCRLVAAVDARKRAGDLLFRTGGEEFVLLLPHTAPEAALHVAEDLRVRLSQAELLPGATLTVSIGVSALTSGQTAAAWIKAADTALYEAKRQGRNRVVVAEPA